MNFKSELLNIKKQIFDFYRDKDVISVDEISKLEFISNNIVLSPRKRMDFYNFYHINYIDIGNDCDYYLYEKFMYKALTMLTLIIKGYDVSFDCDIHFIRYKMFDSVLFDEFEFYEYLFCSNKLVYKIRDLSFDDQCKVDKMIRYCIDRYCEIINGLDGKIDKVVKQKIITILCHELNDSFKFKKRKK